MYGYLFDLLCVIYGAIGGFYIYELRRDVYDDFSKKLRKADENKLAEFSSFWIVSALLVATGPLIWAIRSGFAFQRYLHRKRSESHARRKDTSPRGTSETQSLPAAGD